MAWKPMEINPEVCLRRFNPNFYDAFTSYGQGINLYFVLLLFQMLNMVSLLIHDA